MAKYKVRDLQFNYRYFADGEVFNSRREICEQLIDYHSGDCEMDLYQKLLDGGKVKECLEQLCCFEWKIEKIN